VNFGPLIGGTPAHTVNVFHYDKFPVTRIKIDFPRNFEILIPGSGPRYSHQNFSLTSVGGPRITKAKNWPRPENLAKMGVKFFGGGAISISWGQYCRGRLKSGKGVY